MSESTAKANFKIGLTGVRNELSFIAEEISETLDSADELDTLISILQEKLSEKTNPRLWEDEIPRDRQ